MQADDVRRCREDATVLFSEENPRFNLTLELSADQMACIAVLSLYDHTSHLTAALDDGEGDVSQEVVAQPPAPQDLGAALTPPEMFWFLIQNGIVQAIDYPAVYEFCAEVDLGRCPEPTIVARGVPAQKGPDGWFELYVKTSGREIDLNVDDEGKIDFKNLNAYSEILAGQKLGVVHLPKPGQTGMSVQGVALPADPGEPCELTAGEGVELKFNDRAAFATKAGRAVYDKNRLSVVDSILVRGNVDLTIGNINFNGSVEIKGDVPDDFDVKASQDLVVGGTVGACHIESGGSMTLASMAGKEIGEIVCKGDLHVGYLNQVTVHCFGDVIVKNEIRNSLVKATGRVIVERGAIIGGETIAYRGIEASILGAVSGLRTVLVAGRYFPDADRFSYLYERRNYLEKHLISISDAIVPLRAMGVKKKQFLAGVQKRLEVLTDQAAKIEEQLRLINAEIAASVPQHPPGKRAKVNALSKVMEGVELHLDQVIYHVTEERRGGCSMQVSRKTGELCFLKLGSLDLDQQAEEDDDSPAKKDGDER